MKDAQYATVQDVQVIVGKSAKEIAGLIGDVIERFDERFNKIEFRLDGIDAKLLEHDKRFDDLDRKFYRLLDQMDAFVKRIEDFDVESVARDHKYARLEAWMEAVAKKTGVPVPEVF